MESSDDPFLEELIALAIGKGHINVLDYGYSFFKICLRTIEKEYKYMIAGMALSIGLAFGGKSDDIKDLLE